MLVVWTIYYNPSDYPGKYVVRAHDVRRVTQDGGTTGVSVPRRVAFICDSLAGARSKVPYGLICLGREDGDEPQIVESWI
jgi:hypothetical protein